MTTQRQIDEWHIDAQEFAAQIKQEFTNSLMGKRQAQQPKPPAMSQAPQQQQPMTTGAPQQPPAAPTGGQYG